MKLSLSTVAIPESQVGLSMCGPHRTGLVASAAFGDSYRAIQGRARAERTKSRREKGKDLQQNALILSHLGKASQGAGTIDKGRKKWKKGHGCPNGQPGV